MTSSGPSDRRWATDRILFDYLCRMPIASDFTPVFECEWDIFFTQCTPNRRLRYTELCNVLQLTAGFHAEKGGISFSDMQGFDQAWVLSRMRVEVTALPVWGDRISIRTWIVSLENSRSVRALEVYRNGEKIIGCETFWAVINTRLRRPEALALPHAHFEKFADWHATAERVRKVETQTPGEAAGLHVVVASDLDIVDHTNNVKYLEWCLDLMEPEAVLENRIRSLDMNFMRETLLGDALTILRAGHLFTVAKDGKPCFALALELEP